MKISKEVPYTILGAFGVLVATSAYVVYGNTLKTLPVGASFFWFSLFAFFGSLFFPRIDDGMKMHSIRALYPEIPGKQWLRSVRKIKIWQIALNGALFTVYFGAVLSTIRKDDAALTLLVLSLLKMFVSAVLAYYLLGDQVKNVPLYILGAMITFVGALLFKYEQVAKTHTVFFDAVLFGTVISIVVSIVRGLFDAWVKRSISIPQSDMVASTMMGASVFGFCWMMYESGCSLPQLPTPNQWAALIYLGVMPTAGSTIIANTIRDKLSYQIPDVLDNLRPVFLLCLGFIPHAWFKTPAESLDWIHYLAIAFAITGVSIVALFAKGERKT